MYISIFPWFYDIPSHLVSLVRRHISTVPVTSDDIHFDVFISPESRAPLGVLSPCLALECPVETTLEFTAGIKLTTGLESLGDHILSEAQ